MAWVGGIRFTKAPNRLTLNEMQNNNSIQFMYINVPIHQPDGQLQKQRSIET